MAGTGVCLCRRSCFSISPGIIRHFKPSLSLSAAPPFLIAPIKRYSSDSVEDERAPSTAQEFLRVAEERLHHHNDNDDDDGAAGHQTAKKVYNEGPEETVVGDSVKTNIKHDDNDGNTA